MEIHVTGGDILRRKTTKALKNKTFSQDDMANIVRMLKQGLPVEEVAAQLKRDVEAVRRKIGRMGWSTAPGAHKE